MVITVFGASGQVGKRIVNIALAKGHEVIAFGRNIEGFLDADLAHKKIHAVKGYVFNEHEVYAAIKGSDAVLSALGGDFKGADKTRSLGMKNIIHQMEKANVNRIISVGGMGILKADEHTLIIETTDYPEIFLPVGREHLEAYRLLQQSQLDWTMVGAPDILNEEEDGLFTTNADYVPTQNKNKIKAGNLALFMLMELEKNEYIKKAVGISDL